MAEEKKDKLIVFMAVAFGVLVDRIVCVYVCMYVCMYVCECMCELLRWIF